MKTIEPRLFAEGFLFLEAPRWRDGLLWVADVFDHKVHALSESGRRETTIDIPNRPAGLDFLSDGSLILVSAMDSKLLRYADGQLSEYANLAGHTTGWLNDFAIDTSDRIYVGNFGYDFVGGEARKTTCLHRVDPNGEIATVASGVDFPNGAVVIDNGRTLVVAETWEARLLAFDLSENGELSNRRVFADLAGRQPDGICADAEGGIWTGIYNTGEFVRVMAGGRITDRIQYQGSGISCTLGGPHGRTLFMTAFIGNQDDMAAGKANSRIYTAEVKVGRAV